LIVSSGEQTTGSRKQNSSTTTTTTTTTTKESPLLDDPRAGPFFHNEENPCDTLHPYLSALFTEANATLTWVVINGARAFYTNNVRNTTKEEG